MGSHRGQDLLPQALAQLLLHLGAGLCLGLLLLTLLLSNQVLSATTLLLIFNAVLHILVLKQHPEELDQVEQEEQEYGDHNDHKESGGRLKVIKHLAQAGDPDTGIFTHDLRLVNRQSVHCGVLFTLGFKDQESVTIVDLVNGVGIEYPLSVDHSPIGDDISPAQLAGILHGGIKDQIAGQQNGVHRFRLDGEHPDTEKAGYAVAGGVDKGHISAESCQYNGNDQHRVHYAVEDSLALAFFRNGLSVFAGIGDSRGGCFLFQLLHREASLLWLVFLL